MPIRLRRVALLVMFGSTVVCGAAVSPTPMGAQSLNGQLTILEKDGSRSSDLANAVIWLEPAGGTAPAPRVTAQIAMEGKQFVPHVEVVTVGSTVTFPNHDPFRHNVFSKSGPIEFDLDLYGRGQSREFQFARAGVFPIFCNIHARMVAYVVAIASPWNVRPGADGLFAFAGLPAGSYILRVWHERGGQLSRPLTLPVDASTPLQVQLDARTYRALQHTNKFGGKYTITGSERY
jgi:plastocyanin